MHTQTITTIVTTPVVLGVGNYGSNLVIASSGGVEPSAYGKTAIFAPRSLGLVHIHNDGIVQGGVGAYSVQGVGGSGGVGIDLATAGSVTNAGTLAGGIGGYGLKAGGEGGAALILQHGGLVSNTGLIIGGNSGSQAGYYNFPDRAAGDGVILDGGGRLTNQGTIAGGNGSYGNYTFLGGAGGVGVSLGNAGFLNNDSVILGGSGAPGYTGANGGAGVVLAAGATAINHGSISGGAGGNNSVGYSGNGGAGVIVAAGAMLANGGAITGGAGSYTNGDGPGGNGGAGVDLQGGTFKMLSGTVTGGASGTGASGNGNSYGGAGVYINGGLFVAMGGTISGGTGPSANAAAVQFGGTAGTLAVYSGAVFKGAITANSAAADTLLLEGINSGTLSGFGTSITGFTTIDEASHGHWTLGGTISGNGTLTVGSAAILRLEGSASIASLVFGQGGQELLILDQANQLSSTLSGFGTGDIIDLASVQAKSLTFNDGTLSLLSADHSVLDTLKFAGHYTSADFALQAQGNGTDISFKSALPHTQLIENVWHPWPHP